MNCAAPNTAISAKFWAAPLFDSTHVLPNNALNATGLGGGTAHRRNASWRLIWGKHALFKNR